MCVVCILFLIMKIKAVEVKHILMEPKYNHRCNLKLDVYLPTSRGKKEIKQAILQKIKNCGRYYCSLLLFDCKIIRQTLRN